MRSTGDDADFGDDISRFRNWVAAVSVSALQTSTFVEVDLRNAFTLHPYYLIDFDLVNSSYTPSADGSAITGVSAVTFLHFHISTSPGRLGLQQVQALHYISYYFIEVDLVNCFCTTPVLFHWQLGSSRSTQRCLATLGIAQLQFFIMEFGQHLFTSLQNYMGQKRQQDSPRRRMWQYGQRLSRYTSRFLTMFLRELLLQHYIRTISLHVILWNCSCAPSADWSVSTGDDADFGDDISRFRNWIELQQFQFLRYNRASFVEVDFAEVLLHYIRTISSPLISWIALTLHQLMDPPLPGVLRWHFHTSTSPDPLSLQQIQASHYISTTSLRLILWTVFALHPYYFIDSAAGQDQLSGCLANLGFALHQYFGVEFVQHLLSNSSTGNTMEAAEDVCERNIRSMDFSQ